MSYTPPGLALIESSTLLKQGAEGVRFRWCLFSFS